MVLKDSLQYSQIEDGQVKEDEVGSWDLVRVSFPRTDPLIDNAKPYFPRNLGIDFFLLDISHIASVRRWRRTRPSSRKIG